MGGLQGPSLLKVRTRPAHPKLTETGSSSRMGGSEGRDGGTLSDKLPAEVVFGARLVGVDGCGQPPRRVQGSKGAHGFVDLEGAPAPVLVEHVVHVVVIGYRPCSGT